MGPAALAGKIFQRKWFLHSADEEGEHFEAFKTVDACRNNLNFLSTTVFKHLDKAVE